MGFHTEILVLLLLACSCSSNTLSIVEDASVGPASNMSTFKPGTPNCAHELFCEEVDNYPSKYIEYLLQNEGKIFKKILGNYSLQGAIGNDTVQEEGEEQSYCRFRSHFIYPQAALTVNGEWVFVVNHGQYGQPISAEVCINPDKPCEFSDTFPLGYETNCRQKYTTSGVLAVTKEGKMLERGIAIPCCCLCTYKLVGP